MGRITSDFILKTGVWLSNQITFPVFSPLFQQMIPIMLSFDAEEDRTNVSETALNTIHEFLNWNAKERDLIQEGIWQHCLGCHQSTRSSYDGGQTWVESTLEANLAESEIQTKEDALTQMRIRGIYLANHWGEQGRILWFLVRAEWDPEHDINFTYQDGVLTSIS